ncbi:F-box domain-containing protein [Mycena sanguinolenta]|uniref:F-box domain-containing protein n=1 Tax=Mycena sanguinolenta TaxID=230812 RepID=A0A8H7CRX1_9AGAR|nr:F-box domain-containing protein [Mycena sanguinolenta]
MATASSFSVRAILEQAREYSRLEMERRVQESELRLKSLESALTSLMELRDRERAVLDMLKYLLSPIYTLPAELLAEVFERAIDAETHIMDVFRVSQVCSDWRQIAHDTPRLWTRGISVTLDNKGDRREQAHTDGWKAWLARSAALTIPIALRLESADICHDLLGEVLKTASRWRYLRLDLPDHGLTLIRRLAQHKLDSLEGLDLEDRDFIEPLGGVIPSFTTAPRLRKLRMGIYSSLPTPILVPWSNLTDLTLHHCPTPDLALDVLAPCTGLAMIIVRTSGWLESVLPRSDTLVLAHLDALTFVLFGDAKHFTPFFGSLSTPALQRVCVDFAEMRTTEHWTEARFTAFQLRAPNITWLELLYADLTSDDFAAAILHAPSLTHLKLFRCSCFDDTAITALRYEDGVAPLAPRLNCLVLEGMLHDVSDDILASMIASRWWTDTAFASRSDPPVVARWTHVELWYDLSEHFLLKDIPSDILITSTRSYPYETVYEFK